MAHLGRCQFVRGHLVKQRLERVVIVLVDDRETNRRVAQLLVVDRRDILIGETVPADTPLVTPAVSQRLVIETVPGLSAMDTVLGLFDSRGTLLFADDDGGVGTLSRIAVRVTADGHTPRR